MAGEVTPLVVIAAIREDEDHFAVGVFAGPNQQPVQELLTAEGVLSLQENPGLRALVEVALDLTFGGDPEQPFDLEDAEFKAVEVTE